MFRDSTKLAINNVGMALEMDEQHTQNVPDDIPIIWVNII